MDLNHVDWFVRVVEHGTFTKAAQLLGLPKSSISRAVTQLERDLGVTLLTRTTRHLALTDVGRAYYEEAKAALARLSRAQEEAHDAGDEPRGTVWVTAPPDPPVPEWFADILPPFCAAYPRIRVRLVLTSRYVDLNTEPIDLAVRGGELEDSSLIARKIGVSPFGVFASPEYLARRGTPERLTDVENHDCVVFLSEGERRRWTLSGPCGRESIEVSGPVVADSLYFTVLAAERGLGLALLPFTVAGEAAAAGRLTRVLHNYALPGGALHIVHRAMPHVPRRVSLLRDHLAEKLKVVFDEAARPCRGK